jgi:hypothetical protein
VPTGHCSIRQGPALSCTKLPQKPAPEAPPSLGRAQTTTAVLSGVRHPGLSCSDQAIPCRRRTSADAALDASVDEVRMSCRFIRSNAPERRLRTVTPASSIQIDPVEPAKRTIC